VADCTSTITFRGDVQKTPIWNWNPGRLKRGWFECFGARVKESWSVAVERIFDLNQAINVRECGSL
jgi:hypothetical protein